MHAMKSSDYDVLGISTYQHIVHTVLVEAAHELVLGGEGHRSLARLLVSKNGSSVTDINKRGCGGRGGGVGGG